MKLADRMIPGSSLIVWAMQQQGLPPLAKYLLVMMALSTGGDAEVARDTRYWATVTCMSPAQSMDAHDALFLRHLIAEEDGRLYLLCPEDF